jgi:hypothetical protein
MSQTIIILVAGLYLLTGIDLVVRGQIGLGVAFLAYSVSNVGLFMAARGM